MPIKERNEKGQIIKKQIIKGRSRCSTCGEWKELIEYNIGDRYRCRACEVKRSRKDSNKRLAFLSELKISKGCFRCGFKEHSSALDFHHVFSEDKVIEIQRFRRSGGWQRFVEEVKKCIVLCANCHKMYHNNVYTLDIILEDYWNNFEDVVLKTGKKHEIY